MTARITLSAYAKLNLALYVVGLRKDGYHEIVSIVQGIDLADEVSVAKRVDKNITVETTRPDVPAGEKNIAYKAAAVMQSLFDIPYGFDISIEKTIPPESGLGGGSSDAAAVIMAINQLSSLGLGYAKMAEIGAGIGSDVPFFFSTGSALVSGRGEKVKDIKLPFGYTVIIVKPDIGISTKWAYENIKNSLTRPDLGINFAGLGRESFFRFLREGAKNSFEPVVFSRYPELRRIKERLEEVGVVHAGLAGSGSAVFAICCDSSQAYSIMKRFKEYYKDVFLCNPLAFRF
ncbi:4-(cytidine 5'-diphospho)-2-C-methyl-D-erythritol kinase [bacterium]|nr:4-(cytidine 5'-diphospho)-2-C-methyl-D-erythritol kinase [bacterium]